MVSLTLHTNQGSQTHELRLPGSSTVGSMSEDGQGVFVFNGQVLINSFSLSYYGITDGSHVYKVDIKEPMKQVPAAKPKLYQVPSELMNPQTRMLHFEKYFGKPVDLAFTQEIVDEMNDPSLALEVSRIRDRYFGKIEGTIHCHRKVVRRFMQSHENTGVLTRPILNQTSSNQNAPSTDVLPEFWTQAEKVL